MKKILILLFPICAHAQSITIDKDARFGTQTQTIIFHANGSDDNAGKYGFGPSVPPTDVIDTTRFKNPFSGYGFGLYTNGNCWEASNVLQAWAWGTFESEGHEWVQVSCPACLIACVSNDGNEVYPRCYRLVVKRIPNLKTLPVIAKTVYRV